MNDTYVIYSWLHDLILKTSKQYGHGQFIAKRKKKKDSCQNLLKSLESVEGGEQVSTTNLHLTSLRTAWSFAHENVISPRAFQ